MFRAVHNERPGIIILLQAVAKQAARGLIRCGYVSVSPRGKKVVHVPERYQIKHLGTASKHELIWG